MRCDGSIVLIRRLLPERPPLSDSRPRPLPISQLLFRAEPTPLHLLLLFEQNSSYVTSSFWESGQSRIGAFQPASVKSMPTLTSKPFMIVERPRLGASTNHGIIQVAKPELNEIRTQTRTQELE